MIILVKQKKYINCPFSIWKNSVVQKNVYDRGIYNQHSIWVDTYWKNPNPAGQYLANIPCLIDINVGNGWSVSYVDMELEGAYCVRERIYFGSNETSGMVECKRRYHNI